ncbi:DUF2380 domain-containing protein [Myxococcaceae bacterium GXIMD 01537]
MPRVPLLACVLLLNGCASLEPARVRGHPRGPPRLAMGSALARGPGTGPPRPRGAVSSEPRHEGSPVGMAKATKGSDSGVAASAKSGAARTRKALLEAVDEARGATGAVAASLRKLAARRMGISEGGGAFIRYVEYGATEVSWVEAALEDVSLLVDTSSAVADPEMEAALLRMTGPRLQPALLGSLLLTAWLDFLHLADAVLQQRLFYSSERLFMDLHRIQALLAPSLSALSSFAPEALEAAAPTLPALLERLAHEHASLRDAVRKAAERGEQAVMVTQLVEMLTQASMMKFFLPRPPPAAPVTLGMGLMVGSNGAVVGSRLVLSAEWVERVRELVRAGVLSVPVASSAVRIHAMARGDPQLPQGLRDALGDGPEIEAMRETGRAGAGMAEPPLHHVLPREHRAWFEQRGFTGAMDIDQFCIRMEAANHQAIHGGGNWRLGRLWPGEWNRMIMRALREAEVEAGRRLTREEILRLVAEYMKEYSLSMNFMAGRR